jgi:hypothetical protein
MIILFYKLCLSGDVFSYGNFLKRKFNMVNLLILKNHYSLIRIFYLEMSTLTVTVPRDNFDMNRMVHYHHSPKRIPSHNNNIKRHHPNISPKPYVYDRNDSRERNRYHGIGK